MYRSAFDFCAFHTDLILKDALGPELTKAHSTYFVGFSFGSGGCPCLSFPGKDELSGSNTLLPSTLQQTLVACLALCFRRLGNECWSTVAMLRAVPVLMVTLIVTEVLILEMRGGDVPRGHTLRVMPHVLPHWIFKSPGRWSHLLISQARNLELRVASD